MACAGEAVLVTAWRSRGLWHAQRRRDVESGAVGAKGSSEGAGVVRGAPGTAAAGPAGALVTPEVLGGAPADKNLCNGPIGLGTTSVASRNSSTLRLIFTLLGVFYRITRSTMLF